MIVIPAVDIKDGKVVRLLQGDFERSTAYSVDPLEVAQRFAALDVSTLHVVDLDGALTGSQENVDIVRSIARDADLAVQIGGGVRDAETIQRWLDAGVTRCVIGSAAITAADDVVRWLAEFGPERIVIALDVSQDSEGRFRPATHGWTRTSDLVLHDCVARYREAGLVHLLCTDISRDGALTGPNTELYADILERFPDISLQASGGVRDIDDLVRLREIGAPAAITGRALLDGRITAEELSSFRRSA